MYGSRFFVRRFPEPLPVLSCDGVGDTAEGARLCVEPCGGPEKEFCALLGLLPGAGPVRGCCVDGGFGEGLELTVVPPGGVVALPAEEDAIVVGGLAVYCWYEEAWLDVEYCCWCWYLLPPVMHT